TGVRGRHRGAGGPGRRKHRCGGTVRAPAGAAGRRGGGRMSAGRILMVVVVSALATASLGWLARAPYHPPGSDTGLLRLSWRLRGEKVESCRPRTQAELDALPVHMRTPEVCEGRL